MLLKETNLTKIQLNTLLLDFLADGFSNKKIGYEQKARLRRIKAELEEEGRRKITVTNKGVSRGAFNRVLKQARKNVISSIYTIILLGYLGFFEDPRLQQYLELAEELREYYKTYEKAYMHLKDDKTNFKEVKEILAGFQRHLCELIEKLSDHKSLK